MQAVRDEQNKNRQTEEDRFIEAYLNRIDADAPDLWDRIEAGLDREAKDVEEKQKKKDSKKLSSKSSFDDMIAYVDENGMITSTPPAENIKKEEINLDEIIIATPKKEDEEPVILRGRVEFFNEARGFGFIKDLAGVDKYFFHVNNVVGNISEGNIVTFDLERGVKGMNAVNICLEKKPVEN